MAGRIKYSFCLALFLFTRGAIAQEEKLKPFELKGYIKDLQTVSFMGNSDSLLTSNLIHNRINFKWNISKYFSSRIELRNRIFYGETVKSVPGFGNYISADAGYFNLTKLWLGKKALVGVSTLDRALVNYSFQRFSVTAGRQRINWGINTIWNPNDLFNAYNFLDFDYEERPGSDAIRIQYSSKKLSSLEIVFKPSKEKNQSTAAALFKFNKWKYDFQFLGGINYDDIALGTGWAGNIKGAGFKGEITYFKNKTDFAKSIDDLTASMMIDYSLKNSWYVSASALYVKNPVTVLPGTINTIGENISVKSLMPYRWSFYAGIMKGFTPIISGNFALIYSPEKNSFILFPSLSYSIAQNFDLDVTVQSFFNNDTSGFNPATSCYLRMRWSF